MDRNKGHEGRVVRPGDLPRARKLDRALVSFAKKHKLPGIQKSSSRDCLVEQLVESIRRIKYVSVIRDQTLSESRLDPNSELFDPLKAAILRQRRGEVDEAFWLVFLFVHFGKHRHSGWRLASDVYGALGSRHHWTWARVSSSPKAFRKWLDSNSVRLRSDGIPRHFGNHRKYESIDAWSNRGTGASVESYVNWIAPHGTHPKVIAQAMSFTNGNSREAFDYLYHTMNVISFGRTAKFDYLTMLAKLGLAPIRAGSPYLEGSSGPLKGARLLFGADVMAKLRTRHLDDWLIELGAYLEVDMQTVEDALCNWQKSPELFKSFRG